jgi:hypothetical protein
VADEVVGSAKITIDPDLSGFGPALEEGVQQAADAAAEALVSTFRAAAESSAAELSQIGQAGFVDVTTTADTAAADLEAAFGAASEQADAALSGIGSGASDNIVAEFTGTGEQIADELSAGAAAANSALSGIGAGAGDEIADEFQGVGDQIAADIEAGALAAQTAVDGIGTGAGDTLASEFAGAGEAIASNVSAGATEASAALSAIEGAGQGVVENLAQGFQGLGKVIAVALGAVAVGSFVADAERVQSIAGVTNQLIETTGGVANVTAAEIVDLGDQLQKVAGIESELVQEGANVLLTFKNVRNEVGEGNAVFDRAIAGGADLAAVLGGDMSSASLQLGKALQDPVRGLSLLGRAGVTFTAEQKDLVRALVESGDTLSAQKIILDELESQVGGAAEAAAKGTDRIRFAIGDLGEEFGLGLLPAIDKFADEIPSIVEELGPQVRELGEALGEGALLAVDALLALTPLLGTTTDLLVALTPVLELAVDLLGAIPDPVLQGAAAIFLANKALVALRGTALLTTTALAALAVPSGAISGAFNNVAAGAPKAGGGLRSLTQGASGATAAIGLGITALTLYNDVMADAEAEGRALGDRLRESFDPSTATLEELANVSRVAGEEIERMEGEIDDSFLGRNGVNRDFNAAMREGIEQTRAFRAEVDAAAENLRRLEAEAEFGGIADDFVGISDSFAAVKAESDEVYNSIRDIRVAGEDSDEAFLNLANTLDQAALSEEGMAEAASLLGVEVADLEVFVENVTGAVQGFIDTAVGGLPSVSEAFEDTNESGLVSAREFIDGLNAQALRTAAFFADLRVITEAGFGEVAGALAEQGADIAGTAAKQIADAARAGNTTLLEETQAGLDARDGAIADSTAFLRDVLGPEYVSESGIIAQEAAALFGENLTFEEQTRIGMELAATGLDEEGQQVAAIAALQGAAAARRFGEGLNLSDEAIDAAVAAGIAINENAPVDEFRFVGGRLGGATLQGLLAGLRSRSQISEIERAMRDVAAGLEIAAEDQLGISSPSTVAIGIAEKFNEGLAVGLRQSSDEVTDEVSEVARQLAETAAGIEAPELDAAQLAGFAQLGADVAEAIAAGIDAEALAVIAAAERVLAGTAGAFAAPVTDSSSRSLQAAAASIRPALTDSSGQQITAGPAPIIIERLVLPSTQPELAASALIGGLVGITTVVGNR